MIRWYLNLAQNLKMFQNCLTMPHTTVPTIWMDTALWVSCSAYLSGIEIKYLIFPFLLVIVCGRKKIQTGTGSLHDPAGYTWISQQRFCHHPLWQLIYKTEPGIHRWWISKSGSDWQCKDWFCHVWSCTCTDRKWPYEIRSTVAIFVSLEYWNKLLWIENVLVFL